MFFLFVVFGCFSAVSGQSCELTTNDVLGPFFEENAPVTYDIAPVSDYGDKTLETYITGQVLNRDCKPAAGAVVDIWYAGGKSGGYTFPPDYLWYRGKTTSDKDGRYGFHATYPVLYEGRPIKHYHIKVIAGRKEFITQMYFKGDIPRSFNNYVRTRSSQLPEVQFRNNGVRDITFNIVLDI